MDEIVVDCAQVAPPSVETNASMEPAMPSMGTSTVSFGWTCGTPPMPLAESVVLRAGFQVRPPSIEVLIQMRALLPGWSHSMYQWAKSALGGVLSPRIQFLK